MSTSVLNRDVCTIQDAQSERIIYFFLVFLFTVLFTLFAGMVNLDSTKFLVENFAGINGTFFDNAWIAIQEEVTTRLFPALFAYLSVLVFTIRSQRCYRVGSDALLLGILGGLTMAVLELINKVHTEVTGPFQVEFVGPFTPFFWEHPDFTVVMLPVVLMHAFNGALVIGVFFKSVSDGVESRDLLAIIAAVVVAMAIHFVWNVWWVNQQWFWDWWVSLF